MLIFQQCRLALDSTFVAVLRNVYTHNIAELAWMCRQALLLPQVEEQHIDDYCACLTHGRVGVLSRLCS